MQEGIRYNPQAPGAKDPQERRDPFNFKDFKDVDAWEYSFRHDKRGEPIESREQVTLDGNNGYVLSKGKSGKCYLLGMKDNGGIALLRSFDDEIVARRELQSQGGMASVVDDE